MNLTRSILHIGYWRGLWSSQDFTDKIFEDCVDVIHIDIVNVWNLRDDVGVRLFSYQVYLTCSVRVVSSKQNLQDKDV